MANRKDWVVGLIAQIVRGAPTEAASKTAEMIVERLMEEGLLVIGYGDKDVERVVQKFTDSFGTTKTSRQDRWAAHRLARKYGSQAVCGIIQILAENSTEKYAPVVGSITQLEEKWVSVLRFVRKQTEEDKEVDI